MKKKAKTQAEKDYHSLVASMGCLLCSISARGFVPAQVHHLRTGMGGGQRASHWLVMPLCDDCHLGPGGYHGDRSLLKVMKVEELDLLALTIEKAMS